MNKQTLVVIGLAAFSTTTGVVAGYLAANKRLENKYVAIVEKEIEETKNFYASLHKDEYPTPEDAVKALVKLDEVKDASEPVELEMITPGTSVQMPTSKKAHTDYAAIHKGGSKGAKVATEKEETAEKVVETTTVKTEDTEVTVEHVEVKATNVFDGVLVNGEPFNPDEWDLEAEMENRRSGRPYVITDGEYETNEDRLDILQLTYFRHDDTLLNEESLPVDNSDVLVGDDNLRRFGHGSGDPRTVFVRNDRIGAIFEITLDEGSYADQTGFGSDEPQLRHSSVRYGRRLRDE